MSQNPNTHVKYLPFSIKFDIHGNVVVLDEHGHVIKPSDVEFPADTSELINLQSITSAQVKGACSEHADNIRAASAFRQCYTYINCSGILYRIPIPCP